MTERPRYVWARETSGKEAWLSAKDFCTTLLAIEMSPWEPFRENQNYKDIIVNPETDELAIEGSCVALVRESI